MWRQCDRVVAPQCAQVSPPLSPLAFRRSIEVCGRVTVAIAIGSEPDTSLLARRIDQYGNHRAVFRADVRRQFYRRVAAVGIDPVVALADERRKVLDSVKSLASFYAAVVRIVVDQRKAWLVDAAGEDPDQIRAPSP